MDENTVVNLLFFWVYCPPAIFDIPAYLSFLLPECLSVFLSVPVSVSLPVFWLSVPKSACLSVCLSFRLTVCLCVRLSVLLSDCLSVCLSLTCPPAFPRQPVFLIVSLYTVHVYLSVCPSLIPTDWLSAYTCYPFANLPVRSYICYVVRLCVRPSFSLFVSQSQSTVQACMSAWQSLCQSLQP